MITPWPHVAIWGWPAWIVVAVGSLYPLMISLATVVAALHPDAKRRADALKALELLLTPGRLRARSTPERRGSRRAR
jgi:hypothetical protein